MNGTFHITLRTPFGLEKGILTFVDENGKLSGSIRAMGSTSLFKDGKMNGNSFEFSGILNASLFNFSYTAKGVVNGDTIQAVATTNSGTFQIHGTRAT